MASIRKLCDVGIPPPWAKHLGDEPYGTYTTAGSFAARRQITGNINYITGTYPMGYAQLPDLVTWAGGPVFIRQFVELPNYNTLRVYGYDATQQINDTTYFDLTPDIPAAMFYVLDVPPGDAAYDTVHHKKWYALTAFQPTYSLTIPTVSCSTLIVDSLDPWQICYAVEDTITGDDDLRFIGGKLYATDIVSDDILVSSIQARYGTFTESCTFAKTVNALSVTVGDLTAGRIVYVDDDGKTLKDEVSFEYDEDLNTLYAPNASFAITVTAGTVEAATLRSTDLFAGRVTFCAADGKTLDDDGDLSWNSNTNTLSAARLLGFAQGTFGDGTTNYANFDNTGHLTFVGTAKPWEDLRIEPVARTTGSNAPTFEQWRTDGAGSRGVYLYSFDDAAAGSEKEIHLTIQMPHAWDGGAFYVHVHWIGNVADTTATPRWGLEYTWRDVGGTFPVSAIIYTDGNNYTLSGTEADIVAYRHYISKFAALTPTATEDNISMILIGRLFRDSANGADTYNAATNKCGLLYVDAHYQLARIGSTDEYTA